MSKLSCSGEYDEVILMRVWIWSRRGVGSLVLQNCLLTISGCISTWFSWLAERGDRGNDSEKLTDRDLRGKIQV